MIIYQGIVASEIVIGSIETKMGVGNGRTGHVKAVDNLLEERRGTLVGGNVVNGEELEWGKKSKTHCIFNKRINVSHDKQSNHMIIRRMI